MTTTVDTSIPPLRTRRGRGGPPLPAPALAWAALTVAATATHPGTRPGADAEATLALLREQPVTGGLSAVLLLASAVPLAVLAAAVHHRLGVLGARVAGPTIALVGGVLAASSLALSGVAGWTAAEVASSSTVAVAPVVSALTALAFGAGGPAFAVAFALFLAGIAVPALVLRLVPRGICVAGLVIAALGVVALLVPAAGPLLPVVRFGGLVWLVAMSVLLPTSRRRVVPPVPQAALGDAADPPSVTIDG